MKSAIDGTYAQGKIKKPVFLSRDLNAYDPADN